MEKHFKPGSGAHGHFKPGKDEHTNTKTEFTDGHKVAGAHHVGHGTHHAGHGRTVPIHNVHHFGPQVSQHHELG